MVNLPSWPRGRRALKWVAGREITAEEADTRREEAMLNTEMAALGNLRGHMESLKTVANLDASWMAKLRETLVQISKLAGRGNQEFITQALGELQTLIRADLEMHTILTTVGDDLAKLKQMEHVELNLQKTKSVRWTYICSQIEGYLTSYSPSVGWNAGDTVGSKGRIGEVRTIEHDIIVLLEKKEKYERELTQIRGKLNLFDREFREKARLLGNAISAKQLKLAATLVSQMYAILSEVKNYSDRIEAIDTEIVSMDTSTILPLMHADLRDLSLLAARGVP